MVDYMIWPWVERLPILKLAHPNLPGHENDKKENPRLVNAATSLSSVNPTTDSDRFFNFLILQEKWRQAMEEDPAVKSYYLTPEQHDRFRQGYIDDMPDYDCLEE